ncbi:phosphoribosylamine--glycine ligase [Oceanobacillus bengalensis]|uniref:Phosphoribosylamine--glycine ligase n=1 Tax=Oceanobacillus bengalensis TaxID=1435466 RepID=A0A494YUK8_9BACI|nr:phosphoribosylamine--glycine ligase [Oceanobacillus bengalensis]RKQ13826.1 phosphoribosylamine--glycine ligase [Oceanobacillus bengalensis]
MNVLIVGRGGREHSIVMSLAESNKIENLFVAPGNGGMIEQATCISIDEMDIEALIEFAKKERIDLTIVGPEAPLNAGIADRFQAEGLKIFAPTKKAALLEGSKSYAKAFMEKYDIPTAVYETFTDVRSAEAYIKEKGAPIVIKADGLAAGKGVVVAQTIVEAVEAATDMLVAKTFSNAGSKIVIEEFLDGREFSLMAFVHENHVYPMIPARDYKRAFDNDGGPNTGGMGAYAPVPDITEEHIAFAVENVLQKAVDGLMEEGHPFTGILYGGLIVTEDGPKVIEFNTRFGDPETQVVLPLLENDLLQVFVDVLDGKNPKLEWESEASLGVVVASEGYPDCYDKGIAIPTLEKGHDTLIVHAGTTFEGDTLVSDGGRVLLVGAKKPTLQEAREAVYQVLEPQDKFFYRNDIGMD